MSDQKSAGQLETELAQLEAQLKTAEEKIKSIKGNRTAGAAALLIGLLLVLFGGVTSAIGAFLIVIGGLTLITAITRQEKAQGEIKNLNDNIAQLRGKVADKQTQPIAIPTNAEDRLSKLADLKAKGLIDDAEYQTQRQKILSEV